MFEFELNMLVTIVHMVRELLCLVGGNRLPPIYWAAIWRKSCAHGQCLLDNLAPPFGGLYLVACVAVRLSGLRRMRQINKTVFRQFYGDKKGFFNRFQLLQLHHSKY
jgi:hypothetical protein